MQSSRATCIQGSSGSWPRTKPRGLEWIARARASGAVEATERELAAQREARTQQLRSALDEQLAQIAADGDRQAAGRAALRDRHRLDIAARTDAALDPAATLWLAIVRGGAAGD